MAALLDADTDWNDKTRAAAKRAKVQVVVCEPCLESLLLQIHQLPVQGRSTSQLKQDFAARFGGPAHDERVVRKYFHDEVLVAAAAGLPALSALLRLMAGR